MFVLLHRVCGCICLFYYIEYADVCLFYYTEYADVYVCFTTQSMRMYMFVLLHRVCGETRWLYRYTEYADENVMCCSVLHCVAVRCSVL